MGAALRGKAIRRALPSFARLPSDISCYFLDTSIDVPGLAIYVAPNRNYMLDGYLSYRSISTADIKVSLAAPPGSEGNWGFMPVDVGGASTGDVNPGRVDGVTGDLAQGGAGGSVETTGQLHGWVRTAAVSGALQVRFGQVTAIADTTAIRAGSWLRLTEIGAP